MKRLLVTLSLVLIAAPALAEQTLAEYPGRNAIRAAI